MTYSIASKVGLILGKWDIAGSYTKILEEKKNIFVIPPKCFGSSVKYWLLLETVYSIVTAVMKWQLVSDSLLAIILGLEVVLGMPQMFLHVFDGNFQVIVAKYVDNMLIEDLTSGYLAKSRDAIQQSFKVGQWLKTPDELTMNSTEIIQTPDFI